MISRLLIANRGEIACRIIRTARRMGMATVAVYSEADAGALHVRMADTAVAIGPAPAGESYLAGEKIIAAARKAGADAIHPGFGFLSENADFARAVIAAGLVWVGPDPASIEAMGVKDAAKTRMQAAGVPVTPGYMGPDQSPQTLAKAAQETGYPVLIKAVSGGGGKGMRKVERSEDFAAALESCRREAKNAFGDDRVLIERFVETPRHIEVQVFGDTHGNVVHLFERDCSLQRRHQKVIEEAPAPGMDEKTREAICSAAVRAAQAIGYVGAGTIEFIADASEGLRADRIWFMEMNTRLQVEHPVTEAITGVDLVEWQLRIAMGEPLPKRQADLGISGWAVEARLYAEDPAKDFLPSTGRLDLFAVPHEDVRVETGVEAGDTISSHYDPMIAKLIAHGQTRAQAIDRLAQTCRSVAIHPLRTNAAFLARALLTPAFASGAIDTGFIARHGAALTQNPDPSPQALALAARSLLPKGQGPWSRLTGFRSNADPDRTVRLRVDGEAVSVELKAEAPSRTTPPRLMRHSSDTLLIAENGAVFAVTPDSTEATRAAASSDGTITAPIPGRISHLTTRPGDHVAKGDVLVVLEAMKMEYALQAPFAGTIDTTTHKQGDQVKEGAILITITQDAQ